MSPQPSTAIGGIDWQERRLGRTVIQTYRTRLDIDDLVPNEKQPRLGPKEDPELQRQIEANEGIFEPLLVEPHPDIDGKYRIIDGDRRWTNSKILVEEQQKTSFRDIPVEVTKQTLSEEERLRVWIYIHRQRKEWDAKEKEMVAYRLVDLVGRAGAANILGITVRALDKLVETYELSNKLGQLPEPGASITWAREIKNINHKLLLPTVLRAIIDKVNSGKITNSKDIRKLRRILRDPVAKNEFLSPKGTIETALSKAAPQATRKSGLAGDIEAITESLKGYSWTSLVQLKGDQELLHTLEEAQQLLENLKAALRKPQ